MDTEFIIPLKLLKNKVIKSFYWIFIGLRLGYLF